MANNSTNKVTIESLDFYLGVTGFVVPSTEIQLDLFDKLYEDFDYKLSQTRIDCRKIIENRLSARTIIVLSQEPQQDFEGLKMAARKGIQNLPDEIIKKMYGKHSKKSDDKE